MLSWGKTYKLCQFFLFATKHQHGLLSLLAFVVVSSMVKVEAKKQKSPKVIYSASKIRSYLISSKQIERLTKNASMDDLWFSIPNNPAYTDWSCLNSRIWQNWQNLDFFSHEKIQKSSSPILVYILASPYVENKFSWFCMVSTMKIHT